MSTVNATRRLCRWLRIIGSLALFASLLTLAFSGTSTAQTCDSSGPPDLQLSAPSSNSAAVGTDEFIYVTLADVCGTVPYNSLSNNLYGLYPGDFTVTFPSDTPLVADVSDNPVGSANYNLGEYYGTGYEDCQYNTPLFSSTYSVTCPVIGGMTTGSSLGLGFYVQLPVNQNSATFTASMDANDDLPGTIGSPQTWTTQITHPDLTAQFLDPNNPPSTIYIGTGFNYNITFENNGPAATPGPVSAVIQLPVAGLSSASVNSTTSGTCTYNHPTIIDESRSVDCTFSQMQPGSQVLVSIGATSSTNVGYYTATATIDPNDATGNEAPSNTASITTYVTDLAAPPANPGPVAGAPIPVGEIAELPEAVAVDPNTGMVFAANAGAGAVEAISEATQSVVATDIDAGGAGYQPAALAADPVSGTVYVAEIGPPSQVLVITEDPSDPADDQVTATVTVPAGTENFDGPEGIAVLPGTTPDTGTVYVTNGASDTVSVISEATNTVTSVIQIPALGGASDSYPFGITADPTTGLVYVADQGDGYVSVISGSTLLGSIGVGASQADPTAIAADPDTGTVYVTIPSPSPTGTPARVDVIQEDPSSPADATVVAGAELPPYGNSGATYGEPEAIAVNPNTASVFVSNAEGALEQMNEDTADPAADAFVPDGIPLVNASLYPDFDEVYGLAVDTSVGNPYSGTAYVVSDQTQDMYPVSFPPGQLPQSISFTAPSAGTVGQSATLTATGGGSGYPVVFSLDPASGAGVCTLTGTNGSTVNYTGPGNCVIDANEAGNLSYADAPQVTQTITVSLAPQSISFAAPAAGAVGGSSTLTATGGGSGNPVTFSVDPSSGAGVCALSGDTLSYTAPGSCVIDANQAGNATTYAAAPQVTQTITVNPALAITSLLGGPLTWDIGEADAYPFTASGGVGPYTWSVVSGSLPPGVSLASAGVPFGTGEVGTPEQDAGFLSGTPTEAGTFDFTVAVTDSETPPVTQTEAVTFQVNGLTLAVTSSPGPLEGIVGDAFSFPFTAQNGVEPYSWSVASGSLPPGLSLSSAGLLEGIPTLGGTYDFTVAVTDSEDPAVTATQVVTVQIALAPGGTLPGGSVGSLYSQTLSASGGVAPYTWSLAQELFNAPPPGLALSSSGLLSGTPTEAGTFSFSVTVQDSQSPSATGTGLYTMTIGPGAQSISFIPPATGTAGGSATLTATGGASGNPVVYSVDPSSGAGVCAVSGTDGATVSYAAAGTCVIDANQAGNVNYAAAPQVTGTIAVSQMPSFTTDSPPLTATTGQSYSYAFAASGSPTPTYALGAGAPSWLSIGTSSGQVTGTPPTGTTSFSYSVTASNTAGTATAGPFTVTVSQIPTITSPSTASFALGASGSFTITTTGSPTAAFTESGTLPSGMTFADNGNGTATLSGTPATGTTGSYSITITATNSAGAATQDLTIVVYQPTAITSAASATFTGGTSGLFTITATGTPTPQTITESGTLPTGVTFTNDSNGSATLAGTPAASAGGTYMVTLTASNGVAPAVTQAFVLTVTQAPAITSANTATVSSGAAFGFTVTATGTPTPTLAHTGALPPGITFTAGSNGTATLAGTPTAAAHGTYPITFTAKNAAGTASQGFTLTVTAPPAFSSTAAVTETAGTPFSYLVTTTGYPNPALTAATLPSGVSFTDNRNGTGTLSGTAAAGTYTVTITAASTAGTASQTITLTVKAAAGTETTPAFTSAATATATVGTATSLTVTTTSSPTSYTTNVTHVGTLPAGITFTNNGNGTATLSGTPTAGGSYPMTLTAKNTAGTVTQAFVLTVNATPAITTAASATATTGAGFSFTVSATGTPVPAMTETGTLPQGLTWTDNGNGTATLSGTPAAGQGGAYTLTLAATNSLGAGTQTFTLTVDQVPAITSATSASALPGTAFSFTFTATGYPVPSITHTGSVPGLTFTSGTGTATLSGTPTKAGTYTLVITAKNAIGTATEEFTLTVS